MSLILKSQFEIFLIQYKNDRFYLILDYNNENWKLSKNYNQLQNLLFSNIKCIYYINYDLIYDIWNSWF